MAANRLDQLQTKYSVNCKNTKMSNYRVNYILVHPAHQGFLTIMRYKNPRTHSLTPSRFPCTADRHTHADATESHTDAAGQSAGVDSDLQREYHRWLGTEKNLTQQKHAFTNQKKRTTTQNKHKKLKPDLVTFYDIRPGNGAGQFSNEKKKRGEVSKEKWKRIKRISGVCIRHVKANNIHIQHRNQESNPGHIKPRSPHGGTGQLLRQTAASMKSPTII